MNGSELLVWIHLCAMAAYFGAQFAVIYMLLPAAETANDEPHRRAALITGFRFYNPFSIGMLGIVVITGAMRLTDLKASMKFDYFARIGMPLALKLGLAFVVIFLQTYLTFGLAFRIGRQEEIAAHGDGEPFTVEQVNSILTRIRAMAWVTIILTAAVMLVSLTMMRRAASDVANTARSPAGPAAAASAHSVAERAGRLGHADKEWFVQASARKEPTMYSTVSSPNASPGSSLRKLDCA
jgi:uncharacterized membrane protein